MAVQLATWKGARVIATASAENQQYLKEIGADVTVDYKAQKFEDIAKDIDVVLDAVGGETQARSIGVLRKGGVLVSIVGMSVADKAKEVGVRAVGVLVKPNGEQLAEIGRLIEDGKVKPVVSAELPLSEARKAHEMIETKHTRGKIVLIVGTAAEKK
jgi:NADPH:quinone reductase-like Zn-dependent oxidoreductase